MQETLCLPAMYNTLISFLEKKRKLLLPLFLDKSFQLTVARSLSTINFNVNYVIYKIILGEL